MFSLFKNRRLTVKLMVSYLAIALVNLILGVVGWYGVNRMSQSVQEIARERLPSVQTLLTLGEAVAHISAVERTLLSPKLSEERRSEQYVRLEALWVMAEQAFQSAERQKKTQEEQALWAQFREAWSQWRAAHELVIKNARKLDETGVLDPMALKYTVRTLENDLNQWLGGLSDSLIQGKHFAGDMDPKKQSV